MGIIFVFSQGKSTLNIPQILTLLAALGACTTAITTYFLVRETKKQRESSYKPEIIIERKNYHLYWGKFLNRNMPAIWYESKINKLKSKETKEKLSKYNKQYFQLNIYNIGLGTAREINFYWNYDKKQFIKLIDKIDKNKEFKFLLKGDKKELVLWVAGKKPFKNLIFQHHLYHGQKIDYMVPYYLDKIPYQIKIPDEYLFLTSICWEFEVDHESIILKKPPLLLKISYKDVGNKIYTTKFEIKIERGSVVGIPSNKSSGSHSHVTSGYFNIKSIQ
jgi:hypothetical protein